MAANKYILLGLILVLGTINIAVGLVALCLYVILTLRLTSSPRYNLITIFLSIKIVIIMVIHILYSQKSTFSLIQTLSTDILFLLFLFVKIDVIDFRKLLYPLVALFFLDLTFNLSTVIFGVDPIGRGAGFRPGDFIPRLNGVFGSPLATVAISVSAIFMGFLLQKRWLIVLGLFAILINGTFRAPLTAILIVSYFILLKMRFRFSLLVFSSFIFASLVVVATVFSAIQAGGIDGSGTGFVTGNQLRVIAWTHALEKIPASPWIGTHTFSSGDFEMSIDTIREFGIAEAPWLQLALDYGVIVALLDFLALFMLVKINIKRFYENNNNPFYFGVALFTIVMVTERFYGVLYGTFFLTSIFFLACVSARGRRFNGLV